MAPRASTVAASSAASESSSGPVDPAVPWQNRVVLCGRLTAGPEPVELPSGDPLWRFRVAVERPATRGGVRVDGSPRRVVDAVDCATGNQRLATRLEKLEVGTVVEVEGMLTRRFWRSAAGPASRYEVVVDQMRSGRRLLGPPVAGG